MTGIPRSSVSSADFGEGREGLETMLHHLQGISIEERAYFSKGLIPSEADCAAIFEKQLSRKVYRLEKKLYRLYCPIVTPYDPSQTELVCWQSERRELLAYEGEARFFPGGYRELARHLLPNVPVYRVKFLEPGRRVGAAYDLFVYVNGHWVLLWQPWRLTLTHGGWNI